jgi:hypothetical protein
MLFTNKVSMCSSKMGSDVFLVMQFGHVLGRLSYTLKNIKLMSQSLRPKWIHTWEILIIFLVLCQCLNGTANFKSDRWRMSDKYGNKDVCCVCRTDLFLTRAYQSEHVSLEQEQSLPPDHGEVKCPACDRNVIFPLKKCKNVGQLITRNP